MIRTRHTIAACCALLALAACGKRADLEPRAGQSMPPLAYGQAVRPTTEEFTKPSAQAKPVRSDELVSRSLEREDDPFDLAPGKPIPPFPGTEENEKKTKAKASPDKAEEPE